jgi:hypothetical protein
VKSNGEVTIKQGDVQYGATYSVDNGMLHLKTHTETRSLEISEGDDVETLARAALEEIVNAQSAST